MRNFDKLLYLKDSYQALEGDILKHLLVLWGGKTFKKDDQADSPFMGFA